MNAIIRPPRAEYTEEDLGPAEFKINTKLFRRTDLQLTNPRGMVLQCSHWEPVERAAAELPCVIYLHGNSSCRVEATSVLTVALCSGLTVFAFDFAGSGQSGGDWVSLGYYERDDLVSADVSFLCREASGKYLILVVAQQTVTDYLRSTRAVTTIGLWGRRFVWFPFCVYIKRGLIWVPFLQVWGQLLPCFTATETLQLQDWFLIVLSLIWISWYWFWRI